MRCAALVMLLWACDPVELLTTPTAIDCLEDKECGVGGLCIGEVCTACPSLDGCELGSGTLAPLVRNGCKLCELAPPSQCQGPSDCQGTCYQGAACATGCVRLECCANVCEAPGCQAPAPLGCKAACSPGAGCELCVTSACHCESGAWRCDLECAEVTATCTYQP